MDMETLGTELETACDLLQIIYEDVESNFAVSGLDPCALARGGMVLSALTVLRTYLMAIGQKTTK